MNFVDVFLRVPPLFVMDELLRINLGFSQESGASLMDSVPEDLLEINIVPMNEDMHESDYRTYILSFLRVTSCWAGFLASLCVFVLWTQHLLIVYVYIMTVAIVVVSYWTNVSMMKSVISEFSNDSAPILELKLFSSELFEDYIGSDHIDVVVQNIVLQLLLGLLFTRYHLGPKYPILQKLLSLSFVTPALLTFLPLPLTVLHHAPVFASLLPLALVNFVVWGTAVSAYQVIHSGYVHARTFVTNFGLSVLVETEWSRLNVPTVLRTFWLLRILEHFSVIVIEKFQETDHQTHLFSFPVVSNVTKELLIGGCETLTAVLGMTSIVSYVCHYIGTFFQWVLLTDEDNDKSIGTVSAILFYILALQTGLTSLEAEKRLFRLGRNFCLLFTALLHFIHNIVNPLLMSLSASHNPSLHRHIRALSVCCFLILFPVSLLTFLWSHHSLSTWLLAVSAFSIEVIVKVVVSLMIYTLFLIDACRSTFWEKLDDYVYYIRAFGNTVEFCFGIFLFFNGFWILVFESGGAIRALMMCIHAYFNIWCEARAGWNVFMKRRSAVNKINSLPEATAQQLQDLDDVCAICYQDMRSAKITRCKHFFHGVCLRKWLYIQDKCPLCHDILYKLESETRSSVDVAR